MSHPHRFHSRILLALGLAAGLTALATVAGFAADASTPAPTRASGRPAPAAPRSTAARPAPRANSGKSAGAASAAPVRPATRTLDAVHIEGELDVPEVLFITARDQRRVVGFQHRRYLPGSADVARSTPLPSHVVVGRKPVPPREENPQ